MSIDNASSGKSLSERIAALSEEKRNVLKIKLNDQLISGHALIAVSLKQMGITHAYCVAGKFIRDILADCSNQGIRVIGTHHQQAAVFMALAQNYSAGRITAVVVVSAGPAITNTITGILVAKDNNWPVLTLGVNTPLSEGGMGTVQEFDAVPVMKPLTKWSAQIDTPGKIPEYIEKAFRISCSNRPGPVYLQIPEDVKRRSTLRPDRINPSDYFNENKQPGPEITKSAAKIIYNAKRPVIVIGKSIRWSMPYEELKELVEKYKIPFITSPMGQGSLPNEHDYCFNAVSNFVQRNADTIIIVGARLNWTFRFGTGFARDAKIIQLDADSDVLGRNTSPTIAAAGNIKQILRNILIQLNLNPTNYSKEKFLNEWFVRLDEKRRYKEKLHIKEAAKHSTPMSSAYLAVQVLNLLPKDALCILDGNKIMSEVLKLINCHHPATLLTPGTNGCMGVGIPFGIGIKSNRPDRPVIVITGDFAFGINGMELETAINYDLPVIVIVANNNGIFVADMGLKDKFHEHHDPAEYGKGIRYDLVAKALGGHGEFVENSNQLFPALKRSFKSGKTSVINVVIN